VVDCLDPEPLAVFWSQLLGVAVNHRSDEWVSLHAAAPGHPRVAFQRVPETKVAKNRVHLDVNPIGCDQDEEVARLIGLGARRLDVGQGDVPWVVLADPEGNEFCLVHLPGSEGA